MVDESPPIAVRNLSNYAYCPRLFYYQHVENIFVENADTAAGSSLHRNVDKASYFKEDLDLVERASVRSLALESENLGLRGVIDLIENIDGGREVIDYKKGSSRKDEHGDSIPKDNDSIQCAAYVLLLREEGIEVEKASIYYAAEKKRVPVLLEDALFERCLQYLNECKQVASSGKCPPPLVDNPRCLYCSAYPICLPNESAFLGGRD